MISIFLEILHTGTKLRKQIVQVKTKGNFKNILRETKVEHNIPKPMHTT